MANSMCCLSTITRCLLAIGPTRAAAAGFDRAEWLQTFAQTRRIEDMIAKHSAIMDKSDPARKVALAVDEWGTWYDTPPSAPSLRQDNTLRDALVAATNLNIFHRHAERVRMANIAQMVNVLQSVLLTDGARMVRTPTYYAFQMYVPFQGATSIPVQLQTPQLTTGNQRVPALDVTAAKGVDGAVYIGVIDIDPAEAAELALAVGGASKGHLSGSLLTARGNGFAKPFRHRRRGASATLLRSTMEHGQFG